MLVRPRRSLKRRRAAADCHRGAQILEPGSVERLWFRITPVPDSAFSLPSSTSKLISRTPATSWRGTTNDERAESLRKQRILHLEWLIADHEDKLTTSGENAAEPHASSLRT
jgi:hypothetical protein